MRLAIKLAFTGELKMLTHISSEIGIDDKLQLLILYTCLACSSPLSYFLTFILFPPSRHLLSPSFLSFSSLLVSWCLFLHHYAIFFRMLSSLFRSTVPLCLFPSIL